MSQITSLKNLCLSKIADTDLEKEFWKMRRNYIDTFFLENEDTQFLCEEFVYNLDLGIFMYVSHAVSEEFTKQWFEDFLEVCNNFDFGGSFFGHSFNNLYFPVSIHWFKFLQNCFKNNMSFDEIKKDLPYPDIFGDYMRLLLSGDVELNPGPVQSRPLYTRNNDSRVAKLENAIQRRDEKIQTLIKKIRQQVKHNKIYTQVFADIKNAMNGTNSHMGNLNSSLNRVCDFLENSLPMIQTSISNTMLNCIERVHDLKEDLIKLVLLVLIVRLLMTWKKHKTVLCIILIFIVKFYNMDDYMMKLVMQLKDKITNCAIESQGFGEDLIYSPYFEICGKLIFGFVAFFCIKKIPGKQDWDSFISRLDRIPKAVAGGGKIIDYCSEYFNLANDQLKMMILGKTSEELNKANSLYVEIKEWACDVRKYLELAERDKIDSDIDTANKVELLYKRGLQYQADNLLDKEISRLVSTTLLPARSLFEYVSCSPVKGGGPRMRPITMWLVGESGVGKTEAIYLLGIDMLREMGLVKETDFHHQMYARQVETEYWDGYKSQKIVVYDDAFQMKDDKSKPNPEIFEVIRSCNTFPQHLHMAALHDKNTYSQAEVLIYTTNDMNVKLESITFQDAFYNRLGSEAYKVRPKLEYARVIEKKSGEKIRKLDVSKLNPNVAIDIDIYEFQKIVRDENNESGWIEEDEPISFPEFSKRMCALYRHEKNKSRGKLEFLKQYAIRPQMFPAKSESDLSNDEYFDVFDDTYFIGDIEMKKKSGMDMCAIEHEYSLNDDLYAYYLVFKQNQKKNNKFSIFKSQVSKQLDKCVSFLNVCKEKSVNILKNYPILSALSFVGVIISGFALYKYFEDSVNIVSEVNVSSDAKTLKNQKRFVEVGVSGDYKTMSKNIKRVEVGMSGDVKTLNKSTKRVESSIEDELVKEAEIQGCSDVAAHSLVTDILIKNTYRLSYMVGDKRVPAGNCTFIQGWIFIIPKHFLQAFYSRKLNADTIIYFSQSNNKDIIQVRLDSMLDFSVCDFKLSSNAVCLKYKNGDERDCVVVNLHGKNCHPHRSLLHHFVRTSDQGKLTGQFNGTLATFHEVGKELFRTYQWLTKIRALDQQITIYYPEDGYDYGASSYTQRDCYEYNAPTQVGDCGSLIGIYNHRIERKLIGMHIAGTSEEYGYACPLTIELLEGAINELTGVDIKNISAQFYFDIPKNLNSYVDPKLPEGIFVPVGVSDLKVGQATTTSLVKSCIYNKIYESKMEPALLRPTRVNGVLVNPLMNGLKKCGVYTAVLEDEIVKSAAQDVSQVVLSQYNTNLDKKHYQRVLTYEEAIRGTLDDQFMCAIKRVTSPGFPYLLDNRNSVGKTKWMGGGNEFDFTSVNAMKLRKDVDDLIEDCANGIIKDVIFVDTLKDERRDWVKVHAGKTRVFSAGPQHFVVAFRKYFLPFSAWLMHNRIDNEIAVGTNPYSLDWERIVKKMKLKGECVIAGDFGNFDGSLVAQILWSIFWDIFVAWLEQFIDFETPEGLRHLKICLGLWTHLVHSVHIFDNNVYMWTHSQPSGNPFTVIINCCYNSIIMRVVWIMLMRRNKPSLSSMKHFRKNVSMISYGDDNILNISPEVIEWYNQETISVMMKEIKHEYTDEAKTGEIVKYRTLSDVAFLKRTFRFCPEMHRHVAPLSKDVIYEMLNWTRNTIDPREILMQNIETAFREIVYHGREEYNLLRGRIMKIQDSLPSIPQILTYEQYLHDATFLADDILSF